MTKFGCLKIEDVGDAAMSFIDTHLNDDVNFTCDCMMVITVYGASHVLVDHCAREFNHYMFYMFRQHALVMVSRIKISFSTFRAPTK